MIGLFNFSSSNYRSCIYCFLTGCFPTCLWIQMLRACSHPVFGKLTSLGVILVRCSILFCHVLKMYLLKTPKLGTVLNVTWSPQMLGSECILPLPYLMSATASTAWNFSPWGVPTPPDTSQCVTAPHKIVLRTADSSCIDLKECKVWGMEEYWWILPRILTKVLELARGPVLPAIWLISFLGSTCTPISVF